jgi:hypothetical protein
MRQRAKETLARGGVKHPFGYEWSIAPHVEDVSPEELQRRSAEAQG